MTQRLIFYYWLIYPSIILNANKPFNKGATNVLKMKSKF